MQQWMIAQGGKVAQIDDYIMSLPKGYGSVLGNGLFAFGGESQRISIACDFQMFRSVIMDYYGLC